MVAAVETSLQKLLEGTKQYQVPLYQRAYSWKNAQFDRLWEDLLKLAEDRAERGQSATHFIGSLVLAPGIAWVRTGAAISEKPTPLIPWTKAEATSAATTTGSSESIRTSGFRD